MKRLDWLKAEIKKTEDILSAELNSNQASEDGLGIYNSCIVSMDVSSSSLDSDASSCYAGRSFSQTSVDHQELPSQSEECRSQSLTPSLGAQQLNRDSAEAALHAEFVELSFSPQLGNRRLFFHAESCTVEIQPGHQARTSQGRFDACQWMAEQEFIEGWVYWDVDTTFSTAWAVGVVYPSLMCKERFGRTSSSWCLEWSSGHLNAWHNNIKTSVKHSIPNGIRVILDMEKGQLSFQSLCDSQLELHSFQVDSSGRLTPVF